jgi:hypothetical protein
MPTRTAFGAPTTVSRRVRTRRTALRLKPAQLGTGSVRVSVFPGEGTPLGVLLCATVTDADVLMRTIVLFQVLGTGDANGHGSCIAPRAVPVAEKPAGQSGRG